MQELITLLTEKAGISPEQASKVLDTVKDFVKDKFPMMSGAVDNLLGGDSKPAETGAKAEAGGDFLSEATDKLSNLFGGDK
jgi:hypothetical protein